MLSLPQRGSRLAYSSCRNGTMNNARDPILITIDGSTPTNTVSNVYSLLDVNLDGVIKYTGANNDRDPTLTTVGGSTPTNSRVQQLP